VIQTRAIASAPAERVLERPRFSWIYGARTDLVIALCWVPIFAFAHALSIRHGAANDHLLNDLFGAAFLLSLLHQPLTLALVYGDKNQFALRQKLFTWSPVVAIGLIAVAVGLDLWIIIPIAAVWNVVHTLQQRYGLSRIYGRKSGYGSARLDRAILYSWMVVTVLVVGSATTTLRQLSRVMLDQRNSQAIVDLSGARPYALWLLGPGVLVAAGVLLALIRQESEHRAEANRAKWIYQGSSLLLIASIAFDPLAGFIAYVAAHAIEYFVVVYKTTQSRYGKAVDRSTFLGRVAHRTAGRLAFFAAFTAAFFILDARMRGSIPGRGYDIALYSVGILHFWYDSFIWKLRKPAVAANFGITAPAPTPG
jgi:hypothetical protein